MTCRTAARALPQDERFARRDEALRILNDPVTPVSVRRLAWRVLKQIYGAEPAHGRPSDTEE